MEWLLVTWWSCPGSPQKKGKVHVDVGHAVDRTFQLHMAVDLAVLLYQAVACLGLIVIGTVWPHKPARQ